MEECDQGNRSFAEKFAILFSATYFLEEGARVSLKAATEGFLRGKKTLKI